MARCEECGRTYDTERGLSIHRAVEHDEELDTGADVGDTLHTALRSPRHMFFFGFLAGLVVIGAAVFSSTSTFQGDPQKIGENTLTHYQEKAPPGVSYRLVGVEQHRSGLYAVTLQVTSGTTASNQTVYASPDGGFLFESSPVSVRQDIGAFSE
ncbi:MAG: hypothetical protein SVY41_00095 [Candidatus Nanohaloarchaea archaeon]|nr:hypothetical protein [Candidatus Nanohaloarchaea archaeon]